MEGTQITLSQILAAREDRVRAQQNFLSQYCCPIISFTMNIAGPVKDSPLIRRAFREGLAMLEQALPTDSIRSFQQNTLSTGCFALYAVQIPVDELKAICVGIEESTMLGRLFDLDVIATDGKKLEREASRSCIVCGAPGRNCAARRLHSVEALQAVTCSMIEDYFSEKDSNTIADNAVQSLLDEVHATPKPGLVDRRNNGSHNDMDLALFEASAKALKPYFRECFQLGRTLSTENTFSALRQAGLNAEETMFRVTEGVNTHKGAIFTLGLLCGSIGNLWSASAPLPNPDRILAHCAQIAAPTLLQDLSGATGVTAGERLYLKHGITGVRGEAASGYPSVQKAYRFYCDQQSSTNRNSALICTLLYLIAHTDDTNLYHRGGTAGAKWSSQAAKALLPCPTMDEVQALDDAFIQRNLSPGGCADLLSAVIFLELCCGLTCK